ncbi:uncharacterized protein LOC118841056 [Trichosurus vulpecula]|uniref:uncharacterized protein LOC118841056 n=1 Tax=Trichosurus vulpecula TaxID=9337 RepID=UPI00186AF429|nr:uncharacterized protein LOC118841056 [Trichosurus vulpecula]
MERMILQKKKDMKEKPTSMIPYGKAFMSAFWLSKDSPNTRVVVNTRKSSTPKKVVSLEYLPYFRTYEGLSDEPSTLNLGFCLQEEEITKAKECSSTTDVRHKEDQKDLVPSFGFFPYYLSQDEFLGNPLLQSRLNKAHRIKPRNEEKRGDANRKLTIPNRRASLLGLKPNFDLHSLPENSPPCSPLLFFSSETSEESQADVPLFNGDTIYSAGFVPYHRTEEALRLSPIPIILSSVPRGHEWDGTEIRERNWVVPTYREVCQKHIKS